MSVTSSLRFKVLRRDNYRCRYCGVTPEGAELHVDHVIPKSKGGPDFAWNLVAACRSCNLGKSVHPAGRFVLKDFFWECVEVNFNAGLLGSTVLYEVTPIPHEPIDVDEWISRSPTRIDCLIETVEKQGGVVRNSDELFNIKSPLKEALYDSFEIIELLYCESPYVPAREALLEYLSRGPEFVLCWGDK